MVDGLRASQVSLSESNLILQQATIDPEQAKNNLYVFGTEIIIAFDPMRGF